MKRKVDSSINYEVIIKEQTLEAIKQLEKRLKKGAK
jgi:hypothetical protein